MATFTDDFNRANTSDLGAGWVEVSGDWSIVSNQLSPGAAGGTIILRAADPMASSDHSAQVTIAATTAASQGVWCRGNSNISTGYLWRNDGTSWNLFSVVGGSFTSIGSHAAAAAPGDVAKVQAVGSTIKGYVNGIERVSVTDTGVATGTSVGIRSESTGSIRYDHFTAADVSAGAALDIATASETAQPLTGTKTELLSPAAATHTAQPVTGSKAGDLSASATTEAAQGLTGTKTGVLDAPAVAETGQPPIGAKTSTLGTALETATAQPLAATTSQSIGQATSSEATRPLTGAKSAILDPAIENDTARPVAAAGADEDVDVTVDAPHSAPYTAGAPHPGRWEAGAPC
ncbi:hypothetical protein PV724_44220 [Streptomyces europaeiscabiei]|uniref:hypothetical protein n=1 Tax=Streptomyces europaeiscabiei TaxID=146819 RepID=UPI0029A0A17A|nr:hypothetical protein [Streptomyces europaeiscabiei]MDX3549484.1 hypothetical protein [Streptomyces europaeiscabiei]